jgi:hypothetical protein
VHEKQLVKRCLPDGVAVAGLENKPRRQLRALRERGLVAEQDGRFIVEGQTWRGFVADAE